MNTDAIRAVDSANLLDDVLAVPDHLTDALWRVESARLEEMSCSGVVACGMGGSAIGADLARVALGDRLSLPFTTVRDYELAPWTAPDRLVLCSSYSGNTEETLACFAAAEAIGAKRVVVTTGGALGEAARAADVPVIPMPGVLQPRAAVGYLFVAAAEVAALAGVSLPIRTEIDSAAARLADQREELFERAAGIAAEIAGAIPVIYGCGPTAPAAYRWKTQLNENAKLHAFSHTLPELDHNEIVGWNEAEGFAAVFLTDRDQHPREHTRAKLTASLIKSAASSVVSIETEGETRTERTLWTVMLGDLVSLHVAARRGVDPTPVDVIDRLKDELGRP